MRADPSHPAPTSPAEAVALLVRHVTPVRETEATSDPIGRVLGESLRADRDQPPVDLSLMDGFAVRCANLRAGTLRIAGESRAGADPGGMPAEGVVRIVTGAGMPRGADAVLKREDVEERDGAVFVPESVVSATKPGRYVRERASSAKKGQIIADAGDFVTPTLLGAAALFGRTTLSVRRRVRVGLLATGDEVVSADAAGVSDWEVRDASAHALSAVFCGARWCDSIHQNRCEDDPERLKHALAVLLESCDAVFLTGGVSKGHRDYVPRIIQELGGQILFHRLPQRPGHPALGAVTARGQAIIGLPGNPMSSLCVARRIGAPTLLRIAGANAQDITTLARLDAPIESADHWRFRPAMLIGAGRAALVALAGSADIAGAARTDGFVEIAPGAAGDGPFTFYAWRVE